METVFDRATFVAIDGGAYNLGETRLIVSEQILTAKARVLVHLPSHLIPNFTLGRIVSEGFESLLLCSLPGGRMFFTNDNDLIKDAMSLYQELLDGADRLRLAAFLEECGREVVEK